MDVERNPELSDPKRATLNEEGMRERVKLVSARLSLNIESVIRDFTELEGLVGRLPLPAGTAASQVADLRVALTNSGNNLRVVSLAPVIIGAIWGKRA